MSGKVHRVPAITQLDPGKVDSRLIDWRWGRQGGEDGAPYEFRLTGPDGWATKFYRDDTKAIAEALRRVRSQPQQKEKEPMTAALAPTPPTQLTLFDYEQLDVETRIVVQQRTGEIRERMRRAAQDLVEIGQRLIEVKDRLGHGQFGAWLGAEFEWSEGHARRLMQVARAFAGQNDHYDRFAPTALYLLAAPGTPEEARAEAIELAATGAAVTGREAEAIVAKHKPAPAPTPVPAPAPTPALEDEPLTPLEQQIAARIQDEQDRAAADDDTMSDAELGAAAVPPEPSSAVAGEVIATAPAAPAVPPPPPLTPLTPLAAAPLTPLDTGALKAAEALVGLLEQALSLATAERERLQRALPDQHYALPDQAVEEAARSLLAAPAVRAAAAFLAMSARLAA